MKGYDLGYFVNGKAFIHFDGRGKCNKFTYGPRICINNKGEKLFELPDRDMIVNEFELEDVAFVMGGGKGVNDRGKYAVMNNKGEFLTEFIYDTIYGGSEEGLFEVKRNGKHGHIDITGKEIIPCMYDDGNYFLEGVAAECLNGKWGMVDYFNNTVIPFEYEDIIVCKNNLINAQKNGKWGLINKNNEVIVDFLYNDIYIWCSRECLAYPAKKGDKWGLIDRYGNIIEDFIYNGIGYVSDRDDIAGEILSIIKDNKRALYSAKTKEFITDFDYSFFGDLSDNRILAHKNGYVGFLDMNGDIAVPFIYDSPVPFGDKDFEDGVCVVHKDGMAGMINTDGEVLIPFEYDRLGYYRDGLIYARKDKNQYFIDKYNNRVITFNEDFFICGIRCFNEGFIQCWTKEHGYVYINKKGEIMDIKLD